MEERVGRKITQIIPQEGEAAFRAMESETLAELGKQSGLVIATGGGCVTREENYDSLYQNGTIVWLTRSPDKLPTEGRPLSQAGKLEQMLEIRRPMYQRFADLTVSNDGKVEETLAALLPVLEELPDWNRDAIFEACKVKAEELGKKNGWLLPYVLAVFPGVGYCWAVCAMAFASSTEELLIHLFRESCEADTKSLLHKRPDRRDSRKKW